MRMMLLNWHKKFSTMIIRRDSLFNIAWEELRHDQKWCEQASSKIDGSAKKRRCEDGAQSESSQAIDQPTKCHWC